MYYANIITEFRTQILDRAKSVEIAPQFREVITVVEGRMTITSRFIGAGGSNTSLHYPCQCPDKRTPEEWRLLGCYAVWLL
jgi:hypothetical protein